MNKDPHYLGEFSSLTDVWTMYPSGGTPVDYVTINGEKIYWDEDKRVWGAEFVPSDGTVNETVKGNLTVDGNVTVGGAIYVGGVVIDKNFSALTKEECMSLMTQWGYSKEEADSRDEELKQKIEDVELSKITPEQCTALMQAYGYSKEEVDEKDRILSEKIESIDLSKLTPEQCNALIAKYTYSKTEIDEMVVSVVDAYTKTESNELFFTGENIESVEIPFEII